MCNHLRMEPDGDPEARIRDLERPLAQQADASELGARPYRSAPSPDGPGAQYRHEDVAGHAQQPPAWSPPTAGPHWGSPYYSPPQHVVRKGSRLLWLVPLAVLGVVVIGAAALIAVLVAGDAEPGSDGPAAPTIAGGGGPLDSPRAEPGRPRTVGPGAPGGPATVAAGQSLSVSGIDEQRSVVCAGGAVSVSGMRNSVDIRGECAVVTVSGFDNVVTVEFAQSITASGFDNRVTYARGEPQIGNSGVGNVVESG